MSDERFEQYRKIEAILDKFPNAAARYKSSALFNRVIMMLAKGGDPIQIIDQLITITEDNQKALEDHLTRYPQPFITASDWRKRP